MTTQQNFSRTKNILLWTAQLILALSFFWAASIKLFLAPDKLAEMWPWTAGNNALVKFTALADLLAGLGLILPSLLGVRPMITVYAAYGTIVLMLSAIVLHVSRGEASLIGINVFFLMLAGFIAWGRRKQTN